MMKHFYLCLSILGLIAPSICFGMHFTHSKNAWAEFWSDPMATWAVAGFTWDLILTATAATVWMTIESKRLKMRGILWQIALVFLVGICFSLPIFLYRRECLLENRERNTP